MLIKSPGMPQRSILGPLIFILCITNITVLLLTCIVFTFCLFPLFSIPNNKNETKTNQAYVYIKKIFEINPTSQSFT